MRFTPTYSSSLDQVEIWFARIEREVLAPRGFNLATDVARKLRRYIDAYSASFKPIRRKSLRPSDRIRTNVFSTTRQRLLVVCRKAAPYCGCASNFRNTLDAAHCGRASRLATFTAKSNRIRLNSTAAS